MIFCQNRTGCINVRFLTFTLHKLPYNHLKFCSNSSTLAGGIAIQMDHQDLNSLKFWHWFHSTEVLEWNWLQGGWRQVGWSKNPSSCLLGIPKGGPPPRKCYVSPSKEMAGLVRRLLSNHHGPLNNPLIRPYFLGVNVALGGGTPRNSHWV